MTDKAGRFELADGGTVVLDDFPGDAERLEERIVTLLESGRVERLGSDKSTSVDVRAIFCSGGPLASRVRSPRLSAKLSSAVLAVPPLRERREDIPLLASRVLARMARTLARPARTLSEDALDALLSYDWPGNVRELANVIERAAMICPAETVGSEHIAMPLHRPSRTPKECTPAGESASRLDLPTQLDDIERRELSMALTKCSGNKAEVARMLGIQRTTLYYRLKRLGIDV